MAYATRADIEAIYGPAHLETLVPADVDLDAAVTRAIAAAQGMIDPYLRKRYNLPLAISTSPVGSSPPARTGSPRRSPSARRSSSIS